MAESPSPPTGDPFPLFHLSPLDFNIEEINSLTASELSLVPYHPDFNPATHFRTIRKCFRQKREKRRNLIDVLPLGIFASEEEKARDTMERWPGFELINLSWSMGDDTKVEELTSAQLAVAALHPDAMANEDFVERCEELWFQRRERDFALGLSLPEFVPRPNVPPPKPTKVEKPTASIPVPVSIAPIKSTGPPAWLDEVDSAGSSGASSSLRTAPIPFSPLPSKPVGASSLTNSTVEESKDRRKISSSTGGAGSAEGSRQDATERKRGRSRSRSRSRSRERKSARNRSKSPPGATRGFDATVRRKNERSREREKEKRERDTVDKDKVRDRERDKQRDRDREKDRDKERDRDSKRSKRVATPTAPSPSTVEPAGHSHESSSRLNGQRHTEPSTSASVSASTLYHEDQSRPRHPEPNDSVPAFVTKGLHTVYIRSIDRRASLSDLNSFLLSTHQVGPIALRITRGTSNLSYAFAVYTAKEDAEMVMARLGGRLFYGVPVEVRPAHEPRPYHGQTGSVTVWKWDQFSPDFRAQYYENQLAAWRDASNPNLRPNRSARDFSPPSRSSRANSPPSARHPTRLPSPSRSLSRDTPFVSSRERDAGSSQTPSRTLPPPSRGESSPSRERDREQQDRGRDRNREREKSPPRQFGRVVREPSPEASLMDSPFLPNETVRAHSQLFLSNLPVDVELSELREFFDPFEGIVGAALGRINDIHKNRSGWAIFSTQSQRDQCFKALNGRVFPRAGIALYLKQADMNSGCIRREWRWLDMSKEFRIRHRHLGPTSSRPRFTPGATSNGNSASNEGPNATPSFGNRPPQSNEIVNHTPATNIPFVHPSRRVHVPAEGASSFSAEESKPVLHHSNSTGSSNGKWEYHRQSQQQPQLPPSNSVYPDRHPTSTQYHLPQSPSSTFETKPKTEEYSPLSITYAPSVPTRPRTPTGPRGGGVPTSIKGASSVSKRTDSFFDRLEASLPSLPPPPHSSLANLLELVQQNGGSDIFKRVGFAGSSASFVTNGEAQETREGEGAGNGVGQNGLEAVGEGKDVEMKPLEEEKKAEMETES